MAQRADRRTPRQARCAGNLKSGQYFLVHSDQLYSLEPVDEPMTYESSPRPLGPMDPMSEKICGPEPTPQAAGYGPGTSTDAYSKPTGFFLDRYVY